ncbi:VOC family protein [Dokdonella immobilis]|uniref:Uncharacterized protein n=1 Tax=Dokdonella immobilis TaxID=578942 RepID=A0A1I4W726_9GAMM|nr:VOC family protein [Dokdonella immobilis]SFN09202.1 hypothetical protein SAMN05216289_10442 [Dokdonella immobilis]
MKALRDTGAVLFACNLSKVADFYAAIVPMRISRPEPGLIVLEADGFELIIHGIPEQIAQSISIASPPARRTDTPLKLALPVASLAEARSKASGLGGALDPVDREFEWRGFRACDGHDPEGNVVQFRERLAATRRPLGVAIR